MSDHSRSSHTPRIPSLRDSVPGAAYKKGDVIGQKYEVYGVLGAGGCGIIYLVYDHRTESVYALKTFLDRYLADAHARERFHKEASVWVDLDRHPYLVRAYFVDEISGRLFIGMEHIAPDEHGLNTMEGYLRQGPPDLAQTLRWAIQFCHGMEYAYSKGIRCHRDIKPANIMIASDKTVRITDFGLAGVLDMSMAVSGIRLNGQQGTVGVSGQTVAGTGFGTPEYMPPEQFSDAASCDERSDIYSFGIVLFQMVAGGVLPYAAEERTFGAWHKVHSETVPPRLQSPLSPIVARCLEKEPASRYQHFWQLRGDLEPILQRRTCEVVRIPEPRTLDAWEWHNKGNNLVTLGRHEEAVRCYDRALELEPRNAGTWSDKGVSLRRLGRLEEAIDCHEEALEHDPRDAGAWVNKSACLIDLGRREEADGCYDEALKLDPRNAGAWSDKGSNLSKLGRHDEAIRCHDRALELDQRDAGAWVNKGRCSGYLGRSEEAIHCYDKAIELAPLLAAAWSNKGYALVSLGRHEEAVHCYNRALELDPREVGTWNNKGSTLNSLGRYDEAIRCFDKALELNPQYALSWFNKGLALDKLGRSRDAARTYEKVITLARAELADCVAYSRRRIGELNVTTGDALAWYNKGMAFGKQGKDEEAIHCFDRALELDPLRPDAWYNRGVAFGKQGKHEEATHCFDKALELDPRRPDAWYLKALNLATLGRREEAIRCFDGALSLDPRNAEAWSYKAGSLVELGRHEEAISCYDRALALSPSNASTWCHKGTCMAKSGRHQEAIRMYDRALELDPESSVAWRQKGLSLYEVHRHDDAVSCYSKSLGLDPGNWVAWRLKALSEQELGRTHDAVRSFESLLKCCPPGDPSVAGEARRRIGELRAKVDRKASEAPEWLMKGHDFDGKGCHKEAIVCYVMSIELDTRGTTDWFSNGTGFASLGRHEEAIRCFCRAVESDPFDVKAWFNKAMTEDTLGRRHEAARSYRQFITLAGDQHAEQVAHARRRVSKLVEGQQTGNE